MLHRVLTAMALVCVMALPAHANKAREFYAAPVAAKAVKAEGWGGGNALAIASRYIGTKPKGMMRHLWCAQFLGMIEKKVGRSGTGSNLARSYASYGDRVDLQSARPGDIVVLARGRRGGHVGYFVGWAANGQAILISGNSGPGIVRKSQYAASRIVAVVRPS